MRPEDLRPQTLSEIVGQADAVKLLRGLADRSKEGRGVVPHLLLFGPPGTGKTTAARAFARELFGEAYEENLRVMNASSDRGIKVVQDDISNYVGHSPNGDAPFKILFLDESDSMTVDAQHALRSLMETGSDETLFILAANHVSKVIEAVRSRTLAIPFKPLNDFEIVDVVLAASKRAGLPVPSQEMLRAIVVHSRGLARNAVVFALGGDEASKLLELDEKIVDLFAPKNGSSGASAVDRVEAFLAFVRSEGGASEWDDLLETIWTVVRARKILDPARERKLAEIVAITAFRSTQVANPFLQLRYGLLEVVA